MWEDAGLLMLALFAIYFATVRRSCNIAAAESNKES